MNSPSRLSSRPLPLKRQGFFHAVGQFKWPVEQPGLRFQVLDEGWRCWAGGSSALVLALVNRVLLHVGSPRESRECPGKRLGRRRRKVFGECIPGFSGPAGFLGFARHGCKGPGLCGTLLHMLHVGQRVHGDLRSLRAVGRALRCRGLGLFRRRLTASWRSTRPSLSILRHFEDKVIV